MSSGADFIVNRFRPYKGPYNKETPFPFGKFQKTPMKDVPESYLMAIWAAHEHQFKSKHCNLNWPNWRVMEYIQKNLINK